MKEVLPIYKSDRLFYELQPSPDDDDTFVWTRVARPGKRLCAEFSPLNHAEMREVRALAEDAHDARTDLAIGHMDVAVHHRGDKVGGAERIPYLYRFGLAALGVHASSVGADPFAAAPAESQP